MTAAIWASEAPRARRTASSADLRTATIRAASRTVIRPATARLTYSSHSSVSTASAVRRNVPSACCRAELTVSALRAGARSPDRAGAWLPSRFSASYSGCACWPPVEPGSTGNSHCRAMSSTPKSAWIAPSSPGPANTPPTHTGGVHSGHCRSGAANSGLAAQNVEDASRGTTIPVTCSAIPSRPPGPKTSGPVIATLEPGRRPNSRAVCGVTTTCSTGAKLAEPPLSPMVTEPILAELGVAAAETFPG